MKVIIQRKTDDHSPVYISNDNFDVAGWIELTVGGETTEVHVDELSRACQPFLIEWQKEQERQEVRVKSYRNSEN